MGRDAISWNTHTAVTIGLVTYLTCCVVALGLSTGPAAAADHIFWSNGANGVGRANIDGSGVNQTFIPTASPPGGVAADSSHVYWGQTDNTIGRASTDGGGVNQTFVTSGIDGPAGLAVTADHLYWSNIAGFAGTTIGRANIDGSNVNGSFFSGLVRPLGLAPNANHMYWAGITYIGRANIDGSGANLSFVPGLSESSGVAVDANYVYWSDSEITKRRISRAHLDGSNVEPDFISNVDGQGIAVDANYIYWGDENNDRIGRANLSDGSSVNDSFITGADHPSTVAIGGEPAKAPAADPGGATKPTCVNGSRRNFTIHLRRTVNGKRVKPRSVVATIEGRKLKTRIRSNRVRVFVNLRGLPIGRFALKLKVKTRAGRTYKGTRYYKTCATTAGASVNFPVKL